MTAFSAREIATSDGRMIVGRFFVPREAPKAAVLLVPAMGVRQEYYAPLAAWLAMQGYLAATFDYRGCGLSRRGGLRGFDADIIDWAQLDCAAMVEALCELLPDGRLYWIGHSLGGQIFPFVPNFRRVSKFVMVGTGSGYWRENAAPLRRTVWWLWYVMAPLAVRLFGYFPGKRLRKVGDLPRGVMEQWRRWCLNPDYAVGVEGDRARTLFASLTLPIVSISFTDDEYMSARNTESILGFFARAPVKTMRIAPQDIGVARIGHFGFFRPSFESSLWATTLLPELCAAG